MLKHVSFLTAHFEDTLAFYQQLGGVIEKNILTSEGFKRGVIYFEGGRLQFFEIEGAIQKPNPHWAEHIALYVQDLAQLLTKLKATGVTITRDLQDSPSGHPMAFVLDPDGRQVELLQVN